MKLIVISPEREHPEEAQLIRRFLEAGVYRYHLRRRKEPVGQMAALAERLDPDMRSSISLHLKPGTWHEHGYTHWHVPAPAQVPDELPPEVGISESCHQLEELARPAERVAYRFISPVLASLSKPGYGPAFDKVSLESAVRECHEVGAPSVIGLGGITKDRMSFCVECGFAGVAVMGAVWQSSQPVQVVEELLERCVA